MNKLISWFKARLTEFAEWFLTPKVVMQDPVVHASDFPPNWGSMEKTITEAKTTDYVGTSGKRIDEVLHDELRDRLDQLADDAPPAAPGPPEDASSSLVRQQLHGVQITHDVVGLDAMQIDARSEFLASVHKVMQEPAFMKVLHLLMNEQVRVSMLEAQDWEGVKFGRATINGIALVEEEFEKYDADYLETVQPKEKFDKQSIT